MPSIKFTVEINTTGMTKEDCAAICERVFGDNQEHDLEYAISCELLSSLGDLVGSHNGVGRTTITSGGE